MRGARWFILSKVICVKVTEIVYELRGQSKNTVLYFYSDPLILN